MSYRDRIEAKKERMLERAERLRSEGKARLDRAQGLADCMNGTPVIVGHYSEGRHRRAIDRMNNDFSKGLDAQKEADQLEARAEHLGEHGISSDDPEAPALIAQRVQELKTKRDFMVKVNKLYRKGDAEGLRAMSLDLESLRAKVAGQYSWEKAPFVGYELSNLGANIRRLEKRLETLGRVHAEPEQAPETIGEWTIKEDREDNRILLSSPTKPPESHRAILKRSGYRWSPTRSAWVRQIGPNARAFARQVLQEIAGLEE